MKSAYQHFDQKNKEIEDQGLWKTERTIITPQRARIDIQGRKNVLNMCANNYLGLADHPVLIDAARESFRLYGYGLSSVRFICGTQSVHKKLEHTLSKYLDMEDVILYSSCFDANTGLFETLLGEEDAVFSDELNHASIIDGIRLTKAARYRYKNGDMDDLRTKLKNASNARIRLIATDGVFSMDGTIADLQSICDLAEQYDALVMVDDSHATGFIGKNGRGTPEYCGVSDRVDIVTSTLGKALGGASGGFTAANRSIVNTLRQRSRPYLFSNTLAPMIAHTTTRALELITHDTRFQDRLMDNTAYFRKRMTEKGFDIKKGMHPIVPVMFYDEKKAVTTANRMLDKGVYVIGFTYPVVPLGQARIRVQISAAHTHRDLDDAIDAFLACT